MGIISNGQEIISDIGTVCFIAAVDIWKHTHKKKTKCCMKHKCLTFPLWLPTHRLNTVWGRQPTWEHHETSAIRHVLNSVFKKLTNPQNTIHLRRFFFIHPLSSFSMNKDKKNREACHLWIGPLKTTQSLWDHQVRFWFDSPYLQHNKQKITKPYAEFFFSNPDIFIYLPACLAHKAMFVVSKRTPQRCCCCSSNNNNDDAS